MQTHFLFPYRYKRIGAFIFLPAIILGLFTLIFNWEPDWLNGKLPGLFTSDIFSNKNTFGIVETNLLNEILGLLTIVGGILFGFSKEKEEDEFIRQIRTESLVWAIYVNYAILALAMLFCFNFAFLWVMIFNLFTPLLFFIIRFRWSLSKLKNQSNEE